MERPVLTEKNFINVAVREAKRLCAIALEKDSLRKQRTELGAIIIGSSSLAKVVSGGENTHQTELDELDRQIKEMQGEIRFKNYLSFLYFEELIGFPTIGELHEHVKTGKKCPARVNLIMNHAGLDINSFNHNESIASLYKNSLILGLRLNQYFLTQWKDDELSYTE